MNTESTEFSLSGLGSTILALCILGMVFVEVILILGLTNPDPLLAQTKEAQILFSDAWFHQPHPVATCIGCALIMFAGLALRGGNKKQQA